MCNQSVDKERLETVLHDQGLHLVFEQGRPKPEGELGHMDVLRYRSNKVAAFMYCDDRRQDADSRYD